MHIRRGQMAIVLFCIIASLQGMIFFGPVATLYRQVRGVTIFQISIIESVCLLVAIALEVPWGMVADRIGYKRTLVICAVVALVGKVIFWKATSFPLFLVERILLAVVMAGTSGVDVAYLAGVVPPERLQQSLGWYDASGMVGLLVASCVFTLFVGDSYSLAAFLTCIAYAVALVCTLLLPPVAVGGTTTARGGFGAVFRSIAACKAVLPVVLGLFLIAAVNQSLTVFIMQLKYVDIGMSSTGMGIAFFLVTICSIIGSACAQYLRRRWAVLGCLVVCLMCCLLLGWIHLVGVVVLLVCLLRLFSVMLVPYRLSLENQCAPQGIKATVLSMFAVLGNGIEIGVSLLLGKVAGVSVGNTMYVAAGICLVAVLLVLSVRTETKPR